MGIARCHECGLAIRGMWKHGAPKACPACGCDYSKRIVEERALAALKKQRQLADSTIRDDKEND